MGFLTSSSTSAAIEYELGPDNSQLRPMRFWMSATSVPQQSQLVVVLLSDLEQELMSRMLCHPHMGLCVVLARKCMEELFHQWGGPQLVRRAIDAS